jgi:hypothetical protein
VIKPPSNLRKWDAFYSGDPAIAQLPADATEDQRSARSAKLKIALETGRWEDVTVPGEKASTFTFRPLTTDATFRIYKEQGPARAKLAFQWALTNATNLPPGIEVKFAPHPDLGLIATTSFLDEACGGVIGTLIVLELGELVLERGDAVDPL